MLTQEGKVASSVKDQVRTIDPIFLSQYLSCKVFRKYYQEKHMAVEARVFASLEKQLLELYGIAQPTPTTAAKSQTRRAASKRQTRSKSRAKVNHSTNLGAARDRDTD